MTNTSDTPIDTSAPRKIAMNTADLTTDPTTPQRRRRTVAAVALAVAVAIGGLAVTTDADDAVVEIAFGSTWS